MGRPIITKEDAAKIKELLWKGVSPINIALAYAVTPTAISYISTGARHAEVKWPDNSDGPMPRDRIMLLRRQQAAARTSHEILQKRAARAEARDAKAKQWLTLEQALDYFDTTYPDEPSEIRRHFKERILPGLDQANKGMTTTTNIDKQLTEERRYYELGVGAYEKPAPKKKNRRHQKSL